MPAVQQTLRHTGLPFAIAVILSTYSLTNAFSSIPATPSLDAWLEKNNAIIQSRIGADCNGVRGLLLDNPRSHRIAQIPRSCIITASPHLKKQQRNNERSSPTDALAETLLQEIQLGFKSQYFPYICNMPDADDVSLASIGGTWTEEQLMWLGHEPTMQYFSKLRSDRERFVESNSNNGDAVLAGWAHDLVSSRALQGPFGRGGTVRFALLGTIVSFALAALSPFLLDNIMNDPSISTLLESAIPLVLSILVLTSTLLRKEPELAMLPWIDIANHKSKSLLYLEYGLLGDTIILKQDGVTANEASQQQLGSVNFDYGGASQGAVNNKLLGVYGFVEEDNPNDTLHIRVGHETITIGRKAVICTPIHEKGCTLEETICATKELRSELIELDQTHDYTKMNDVIQSQRCWLAAQWRKEKLRLIQEFLVENHS